jgi:hypothetical protein
MEQKTNVVLGVIYCAKCGGLLKSRNYMDDLGVSSETCECTSCGIIWQVAQFTTGEVRIAEVSPDEDDPDQFPGIH